MIHLGFLAVTYERPLVRLLHACKCSKNRYGYTAAHPPATRLAGSLAHSINKIMALFTSSRAAVEALDSSMIAKYAGGRPLGWKFVVFGSLAKLTGQQQLAQAGPKAHLVINQGKPC